MEDFVKQFNQNILAMLLSEFDSRLIYVEKLNSWCLAPEKFKMTKLNGLKYIGFDISNVFTLNVSDKDNKEKAENKVLDYLVWVKKINKK